MSSPDDTNGNSTTKGREPSPVGLSACEHLLDLLVGDVLTGRGNWMVRIRRDGERGGEQTALLRDVKSLGRALSKSSAIEPLASSRVHVQVHPHESGGFMTPGCDSLYAATCLSIGIHLPHLFRKGGPLFDPNLVGQDGELQPGAVGGGRLQRARKFAIHHARQFVFPPSAALASYDTIYLFFLITKPTSILQREKEQLDRIQSQLACMVHAGYPRRIGGWTPLPLPCSTSGRRQVAARLLWAHRDIAYDLDKLDCWTECGAAGEVTGSQGRGKGPPELRLRTLMDGYELADLDLPGSMRQLIATGARPGELIVFDELPLLIDAMARARYGFEDVRLVASDTRFALSFAAHIDVASRRSLALRYRNALRGVGTAYPTRLPYGIASITVHADEDDPTIQRYLVEGGTKKAPFQIEVSHDVLISARRFHRALSNHLRSFPYRVPQEIWEHIVLRRGLQDPRIRLRQPLGTADEAVPLVERIERFAQDAKPLEPWLWESGDPIPWPVLRDGQVVFRLAVLRDWLSREIKGPPPRRFEVATAVRAAGGAPFGAMRFGKRVIRVWTLPYPGRTRAQARGCGRAPA